MSEPEAEIEQEDITQRHRREKKLLQNRIQALKKSSGKLDKKKKRELDQAIQRLESELEQTHLKELSELNPSNDTETQQNGVEIEPVNTEPIQRVSKAQKRREKKIAEEQARDKLIAEQEKANRNGPRNLELNAINKILESKNLTLHMIPSNGDCLYSAISHQLIQTNKPQQSVQQLRTVTCEHIKENKHDFMPFLCNLDTGDMMSEEQFQKYCDDIINTNAWGGQVELQALSSILKCPIHIIQSTNPSIIIQGQQYTSEPLILTYHRHMFGLGEHYNSTKKAVDTDNNKDDFV